MLQVTVTGGIGHPPAVLDYDTNDLAYREAKTFALVIDHTYDYAIYYKPGVYTPSLGYLIVQTDVASKGIIKATGFGAVVVENNGVASTVVGGASPYGQTVLAGNGGLTYSATRGDNTVIAGGGANLIDFRHDMGSVAAYTSDGNDTIYSGYGHSRLFAGLGHNLIFAKQGETYVYSTGIDTIRLDCGGSDTIKVASSGRDLVFGAHTKLGDDPKLLFLGGKEASTVLSGLGSYTIYGHAGGGHFEGGKDGHNYMLGGAGEVTLIGGGSGDTLLGGASDDSIRAAKGNETLGGGGGDNVFDLRIHDAGRGGIATGIVDTIKDFTKEDLLNVGGTLNVNYALNTYNVDMAVNQASFLLADGTKVVLIGYTGSIDPSSFTKH